MAEAFNVAVCPHFLMELHVSLAAAVPNGHYVEHIPQLRAITRSGIAIDGGPRDRAVRAGAGHRLGPRRDRREARRMSVIDGAPVILGGAEPPAHESDAPVTRDLPFWANPRFGLAILIVVALAVFTTLDSKFLNVEFVLFPALRTVAILTVVGLAQMVVLSIGHMNLAVGRMASFGAMFMGISFDLLHLPLYVGLLIGLVAGAGIGALAGWIIATTGVNSFVVTLAMDFALLGLIPLVYSALADGAAFVVKPEGMTELQVRLLRGRLHRPDLRQSGHPDADRLRARSPSPASATCTPRAGSDAGFS